MKLKDTKVLADCLRNANASRIAEVSRPDIVWDLTREAIPEDGDLSQVFLSDTPINLMKNKKFHKVPWITGINSGEKFAEAYGNLRISYTFIFTRIPNSHPK